MVYKIDIKTNKKITDVSKSLYGLFFEDINRAGDGGLYAELLCNRAFDDGVIPESCSYDAVNKQITSENGWTTTFDCYEGEGIAAWQCGDGAMINLTDKGTLNKNRKRALQVSFNGGSIINDGFKGVPVEHGKQYRFYMFAKSSCKVEVTVKLCSADGISYGQYTFIVDGDYKKYECIITSEETDYNARLALCSDSSDLITIGFTSLFPVDTYMGRENGLRKSLVERLLRLKPAFLRFPGGCIVEGFSKETAYRFEDSIGTVWERKPHWLIWSYMTTNGLGYHEYLQFCEDAGIDAMYVFNCGMTCQFREPMFFDDELVEEFYQDAVHAILYAIAPADTKWGRKRAENGHPEPFTVLKYLEIGNENNGNEYNKRYKYFYERLKKEFPQFTYIATDHTEKFGIDTEYVDEHFYYDPIFFASNTNLYDSLDRNGINIYCGEYASTIGCKEGNLYAALGEAAFLTGIERNQDKVTMSCYAPLFQNVAYKVWEPDLIIFNNHEEYAIPSFYMLEMFGNNRGDYVCDYDVSTLYDNRCEKGTFRFIDEDGTTYKDVTVNGNSYMETKSYVGMIENTQTLLASAECKEGNIHICFWDRGTFDDYQKWFEWIVKNGKSKVIHHNGWTDEVICEDKSCTLCEGMNSIEIRTYNDTFDVVLNDITIHSKKLNVIPHITAVCTVDESKKQVITKLVNFTEKEIPVNVILDTDMCETAVIKTLTADSYYAGNSFDDKNAVVPCEYTCNASNNYNLAVKPRSVNVICHNMKK